MISEQIMEQLIRGVVAEKDRLKEAFEHCDSLGTIREKCLFLEQTIRDVKLKWGIPFRVHAIEYEYAVRSYMTYLRKTEEIREKYSENNENLPESIKRKSLKHTKQSEAEQKTGEKVRGISKADAEALLKKLENPKFKPTEEEMRIIREDQNFKSHKANYIKPYRDEYFEEILNNLRGKGQMTLDIFYQLIRCPSNQHFQEFLHNSFLDWCTKKPQKEKISPQTVKIVQDRLVLN